VIITNRPLLTDFDARCVDCKGRILMARRILKAKIWKIGGGYRSVGGYRKIGGGYRTIGGGYRKIGGGYRTIG
jgi:hypothetical protein